MGFTVSTHFCGGHAVESLLAIGHQDVDCGMMDMEPTTHDDGKTTFHKEPCCADQYTTYEIEDDYSSTVNSIGVDGQILFALVYTSLFSIYHSQDHSRPYVCYDAPPLLQDIPVLNQSFLI
jgi:hypothetical protein